MTPFNTDNVKIGDRVRVRSIGQPTSFYWATVVSYFNNPNTGLTGLYVEPEPGKGPNGISFASITHVIPHDDRSI